MRTTATCTTFAVLALSVCLASGAAAQMPVAVTSDAPGATFHLEDIAKYVEQIDQMKLQVSQLQQTYSALTGSRGVGSLFQNPNLPAMLPSDWQRVYAAVGNGGFAGISGPLAQITAQEQTLVNSRTIADGGQSVLQRQATTAATDKAMGVEAYHAALLRLDTIQGLMSQIDRSTDPKAIADLQARVQVEQAAIQNEQTKVQLMTLLQQSEDRLVEAQRDQIGQRALSSQNTAIPSIGY